MKGIQKRKWKKGAAAFVLISLSGLSWSLGACGGGKRAPLLAGEERIFEEEESFGPSAPEERAAKAGEGAGSSDQADGGEPQRESCAAEETEAPEIFVYICGAVQRPDVYSCRAGDRTVRALELSGGFTEGAAREALNLAAPLEDGQMLYVPTAQEWEARGQSALAGGGSAAPPSGREPEKININTAGKEELMRLPGIGERRAEQLIAYREEHGAFRDAEEIKKIPGLKGKAYEKLKDRISVE